MKKTLFTLLFGLLAASGLAQDRIYIATDRSTYLAGDLVYCSLFCTDENGRQSDFSAVSYLELISADGTAAEAKIGLFNGRGAGSLRIPAQTPTGNYRLVAYTARSQAVTEGSRILAVFNANSTARVKDGVKTVPEKDYQAPQPVEGTPEGGLKLSVPARLRPGQAATLLVSAPASGADISVSVYHEDALAPADGNSLSAFLHGRPAAPGKRIGEYEGEIISASVEGLEQIQDDDLTHKFTAILSSAGDPSNVYLGRNDERGRIRFFTNNIYGDRELVCEVVSMEGHSCHISLDSPFTHPEAGDLPVLQLSPSQREALINRKAALRTHASGELDTLVRFLPKREDLLLAGSPKIRYHLDDYNRFPTVREICVEFIHELQFVRKDKRWRIRMALEEGTAYRRYVQENILVLMDGVVLTDHGMLEDFDAMLLEDIDIYRQAVVLGGVSYNGVVNFITKRNYVTALHFPDNVRVIDFKGVSYPVAYPGGAPKGADNDLRQLLYWHPALELSGGNQTQIGLHAPSYSGTFHVVAEGWDAQGAPLRAEAFFEVE